jgi:hypothetical protein
MAKVAYRVKNWSQYNQDLKRRGDITVWIDDAVANSWHCQGSKEKNFADFSIQSLLPALWNKDNMVLAVPLRMRQTLKLRHIFSLGRQALKVSLVKPVAYLSTSKSSDSSC